MQVQGDEFSEEQSFIQLVVEKCSGSDDCETSAGSGSVYETFMKWFVMNLYVSQSQIDFSKFDEKPVTTV